MKFNTAEEVRSFLWEKLNLSNHAITFHLVDVGDDILYYRPGIIMSEEDFAESDALSDIGTAHYDEQEIEVDCVASYMIGEGESDHADYSDIEVLEEVSEESREAMDSFITQYADLICSLYDFTVENPEYDEEADW